MSTLRAFSLSTQLQTLTRMGKVVFEDDDHMTTMDENTNWMKLTHVLSKFSLDLWACCTFTFTSRFLIAFLNVQIRQKNHLSLKYTMYANALNNTLSYTHVSLYVVWRDQLRMSNTHGNPSSKPLFPIGARKKRIQPKRKGPTLTLSSMKLCTCQDQNSCTIVFQSPFWNQRFKSVWPPLQ